jgi:hypothetical protein
VRGAVAALAIGAAAGACVDLFHSTQDVLTACELDASADGCPPSPSADARAETQAEAGPTQFCAWTPAEARDRANHACAWLGACESPMGRNDFGSCVVQARLAYDCATNPNRPARGVPHDLWDCLWRVRSCADVDACIAPGGMPACESPGAFTGCGGAAGGALGRAVRVECGGDGGSPARAGAESCALWGQTCASSGATASCGGAAGLACVADGCDGTPLSQVHWCVDGGDQGLDCSGNGAARCNGFPSSTAPQWVACVASTNVASDGSCAPGLAVTCSQGVATSCSSGVVERLDCQALLGTPGACVEGTLSPPSDWTSPCQVVPAVCGSDSCSGSVVTGCARGAALSVDCAAQGLGPCRMVSTDQGTRQHAACTAP